MIYKSYEGLYTYCYIYMSTGADYILAAHCAAESKTPVSGDAFSSPSAISWQRGNNNFVLSTLGINEGW